MRRLAGWALIAVLALPQAAAAEMADTVVAQLRAQGFDTIQNGRTFLGRLRIVAENGALRREIVLNPQTGEILRDFTVNTAVAASRYARSGSGATVPSDLVGSPAGGTDGNSGVSVDTTTDRDPADAGTAPASDADTAGGVE